MRKRFDQQGKIGVIPISEVKLSLKSRDELPPILRALQHIYVTPELNEEVFRILEERVQKGKKKTGRYGMDLWHILVLSVVRLGLDANYDRLEDFANHHNLIRQIMGVETGFGEGKVFSMQSIKDNISLLDEETIRQINEVVISSGHQLVKKKDEGLRIKVDTYVLESNVHFPTDMNLLWDAGRKSLDIIEDAIEEGMLEGKGWRKGKYWRRELKKLMRISAKASSGGGKDKEEGKKRQVRRYLELARSLSGKIGASLFVIYERVLTTNQVEMHAKKIETLEYFHGMLNKQIDLVERRMIRDETIPAEEESGKTFKKLRHKHSAVESDINRLEHHGLDRCPDKGLKAFRRYCALGVLAANPRWNSQSQSRLFQHRR